MQPEELGVLYVIVGAIISVLFTMAADSKNRNVPFFALIPIVIAWPIILVIVGISFRRRQKQKILSRR